MNPPDAVQQFDDWLQKPTGFLKLKRETVVFWFFMLAALIVYTHHLTVSPVHLNQDEMLNGVDGYSLRHTGRDELGHFLPLYVWRSEMYAPPMMRYWVAFFLFFMPLNEFTLRFSTVFVGMLNIMLIYYLARRYFGSGTLGLLAGALHAVTPAHFIHSRLAVDSILVVPFVTGWLLLLHVFLDTQKKVYLFLSGLCLGIGFYSYHPSMIMNPLCLLMGLIVLWPHIRKDKSILFIKLAAFGLPVLLLPLWLIRYPDTFQAEFQHLNLFEGKLNPVAGFMRLLSPAPLSEMASAYLNYFNPIFLFMTGDSWLTDSTGKIGIFTLVFILVPVGIYRLLGKEGTRYDRLIVAGLFAAFIPGAVVKEHFRIARVMFVVPFAVLVLVSGLRYLLSSQKKMFRWVAIVLLAASPVQFAFLYADYFAGYRSRSYHFPFFNFNIPGALEAAIRIDRSQPASRIYLDRNIPYISYYWRFYQLKHFSEDLAAKTEIFDPDVLGPGSIPAGSLVVYFCQSFIRHEQDIVKTLNKLVEIIYEPDQKWSFAIFRVEG